MWPHKPSLPRPAFTKALGKLATREPAPGAPGSAPGASGSRLSPTGAHGRRPPNGVRPAHNADVASTSWACAFAPVRIESAILTSAEKLIEFVEYEGKKLRPDHADMSTGNKTVLTRDSLKKAREGFSILRDNLAKPQGFFKDADQAMVLAQMKDHFDKLDTYRKDKNISLTTRLDALSNVAIESMGSCIGGLTNGLEGAVLSLEEASKAGFSAKVNRASHQLLQNLALDHVRTSDNYFHGNEVHVANAHINPFAKKMRLPPAELKNQYLRGAKKIITEKSFKQSAEMFKQKFTPEALAQVLAEDYTNKFLETFNKGSSVSTGDALKAMETFVENDLASTYGHVPLNLMLEKTSEDSYTDFTVAPKPVELTLEFLAKLKKEGVVNRSNATVLIKEHSNLGEVAMLGDMVFHKSQSDDQYQILGRPELCQINLSEIDKGLAEQQSAKSKGFLKKLFPGAKSAKKERSAVLSAVLRHVKTEYYNERAEHRRQLAAGNNPVAPKPPERISKAWLSDAVVFAQDQKLSDAVMQDLFEMAVMAGRHELVDKLKGSAINFDVHLPGGVTAVTVAASRADTRILQTLVAAGANVNTPNADGTTALMHAATLGTTDALRILARAGAKLEAEDRLGDTALIQAVMANQTGAIAELAAAGANIDRVSSKNGSTAARMAARHGKAEALTALLNNGADKTQKGPIGESLLLIAAFHNHVEIIQALKPDAAALDARNNNGSTPLMMAALHNNIEAMRALTAVASSHGVLTDHVNITDDEGKSALRYASNKGHDRAIGHLIASGADKTLADALGNTALFDVVRSSAACLLALAPSIDDLNARNKAGDTVGLHAARAGVTNLLDRFMVSPEKVFAENNSGQNALMLAAKGGHTETLKIMASWPNVDINQGNSRFGATALGAAIHAGKLETIKCLVSELNAEVNQRDLQGFTPAMEAVLANQPEALYILGTLRADLRHEELKALVDAHAGTMNQSDLDDVMRRLDADARAS